MSEEPIPDSDLIHLIKENFLPSIFYNDNNLTPIIKFKEQWNSALWGINEALWYPVISLPNLKIYKTQKSAHNRFQFIEYKYSSLTANNIPTQKPKNF